MPFEPPKRLEDVGVRLSEQLLPDLLCKHNYVYVTSRKRGVCVGCTEEVKLVKKTIFERDTTSGYLGAYERTVEKWTTVNS